MGLPFLNFDRLKNWSMYNHHSSFWLIFQKCLLQEGLKVEKMAPNIVFGVYVAKSYCASVILFK